eukprot:scaffold201_cov405-Prasinococcus_capsulatus_cf.AAC.58
MANKGSSDTVKSCLGPLKEMRPGIDSVFSLLCAKAKTKDAIDEQSMQRQVTFLDQKEAASSKANRTPPTGAPNAAANPAAAPADTKSLASLPHERRQAASTPIHTAYTTAIQVASATKCDALITGRTVPQGGELIGQGRADVHQWALWPHCEPGCDRTDCTHDLGEERPPSEQVGNVYPVQIGYNFAHATCPQEQARHRNAHPRVQRFRAHALCVSCDAPPAAAGAQYSTMHTPTRMAVRDAAA